MFVIDLQLFAHKKVSVVLGTAGIVRLKGLV